MSNLMLVLRCMMTTNSASRLTAMSIKSSPVTISPSLKTACWCVLLQLPSLVLLLDDCPSRDDSTRPVWELDAIGRTWGMLEVNFKKKQGKDLIYCVMQVTSALPDHKGEQMAEMANCDKDNIFQRWRFSYIMSWDQVPQHVIDDKDIVWWRHKPCGGYILITSSTPEGYILMTSPTREKYILVSQPLGQSVSKLTTFHVKYKVNWNLIKSLNWNWTEYRCRNIDSSLARGQYQPTRVKVVTGGVRWGYLPRSHHTPVVISDQLWSLDCDMPGQACLCTLSPALGKLSNLFTHGYSGNNSRWQLDWAALWS